MNIVIVGKDSRELDNLHAMLDSIQFEESIDRFAELHDAALFVDSHPHSIVFVDYRNPSLDLDSDISNMIIEHDCEHVVLLQSRNGPYKQFTHYSTSGLVLNDLSVGILRNLLSNVYDFA